MLYAQHQEYPGSIDSINEYNKCLMKSRTDLQDYDIKNSRDKAEKDVDKIKEFLKYKLGETYSDVYNILASTDSPRYMKIVLDNIETFDS